MATTCQRKRTSKRRPKPAARKTPATALPFELTCAGPWTDEHTQVIADYLVDREFRLQAQSAKRRRAK